VSRFSDQTDHGSKSVGQGHMGAGGICKPFRMGQSVSQSVSDHQGRLGTGIRERGQELLLMARDRSQSMEGRPPSL